jgi:hypothetical protein
MKSKHTEGKWIVNTRIIKKSSKSFTQIKSDNGKHIAQMFDEESVYPICMTKEEAEANAKLISAAPELLECLKFISSWILDEEITREKIKKKIDEVIQKAEGN